MKKLVTFLIILINIVYVFARVEFYTAETRNFKFFIHSSLKKDVEYIISETQQEYEKVCDLFGVKKDHFNKIYFFGGQAAGSGEADPFKNKIEIRYFNDPKHFSDFGELIRHELVHMIHFNIARKNKDFFKYFINLGFTPLWVFEGYAEAFSKEDNPYYYMNIYDYPFYNYAELSNFYYRDMKNRSGGYFYSFIIFKYLRSIYEDKYVVGFLDKLSKFGNYKKNFIKYFGEMKKTLFEACANIKRKYPNITYDNSSRVLEKAVDPYMPVFFKNGFLFLSRGKKQFGIGDLYYYDGKKIIKKESNVHSFSVKDNNIIYSKAILNNGSYFYKIFKDDGKKTKFTGYYGVYPDIEEGLLTFSDGINEIHIVNIKSGLEKTFKGYYSKLYDGKIYYFDHLNKSFNIYYIKDDYIRKLLDYEYTDFNISFYNSKPVIGIYDENKFKNVIVDHDKVTKLIDGFFPYMNIRENELLSSVFGDKNRIIIKRQILEHKKYNMEVDN